jgi:O-acetyl-ADP-ribose deacetylase (regulator of RNase III)
MKIQYERGDVLASEFKYVAHGCNTSGVMGAGIALQIKKKYPLAYEVYRQEHENSGLSLGQASFVNINEKRTIINVITQNLWPINSIETSRNVSYDAIAQGMTYIDKVLEEGGTFAMPQVGAGLGGGDWDIIEKIIETSCKHVTPVVFVYG